MTAPGPSFPQFRPQGEAALLVYLGREIDPALNAQVRALARSLEGRAPAGVREVTAAYCALQVQFDPLALDHQEVQAWVEEAGQGLPPDPPTAGRRVDIPVVYGGPHGPDLEFVASQAGLSPGQVIARHAGRDHLCYLVGFTPGFPYLGGLDPRLQAPRLDTPRLGLPPGAVGVAGDQTGIYPLGGPGGWRLLGRSPLLVYDPRRDPPCLIQAGDLVRFQPVPAADFPPAPQGALEFEEAGLPVWRVLAPGGHTTVQDLGRWGHQGLGVPVSGALDQLSLQAANALVGNSPGAAALEMTLLGPKLLALADTAFAVCGADLGARLDGRPLALGTRIQARPGQLLEFGRPAGGSRAVLALAGGLAARTLLGSRSTYLLGCLGAPLAQGQVLRVQAPLQAERTPTRVPESSAKPGGVLTLRAVPGPNQEFFSRQGLAAFFSQEYRLSNRADRRAARLEGPPVELRPGGPTSIVSEPNAPGVVQVPPDGAPLILLREQTVGGYAKIATVIGPDLDLLARALPGYRLRFKAVGAAEAVAEARRLGRRLERLRLG